MSTALRSTPVTFLFTDVEGSTRLWEQHSPAMHAALTRHDALLRAVCDLRGGHVFNTVGDAFHVAFGDAATALDAAVEAQRILMLEPWDEIGPLRVRMALHTGEPWQRDGDYFGPPLNRCARLIGAAHGGQIVLSRSSAEHVQACLPDGVALRDLGRHRLRDLTQSEHIFQALHPDLAADFPRLRSLDTLPNNLPIQLTTFVGRRRELAAVRELTRDQRLVTLTGSGGCGKTRLALQAAADLSKYYHDGAWLVELATVTEPERVPQAVATALGVREADRPRPRQHGGLPQSGGSAGEAPPIESSHHAWQSSLIGYLHAQEALIVLDNCEHVVDACAQLVEAILQACPQVHILATSREALGIAGETSFPVPSLSLPTTDVDEIDDLIRYEAIRLFIQRAGSVQPGFKLDTGNATAVVQIVRRLDGIPLAIELATARLKLLSPEQIALRLDDRFRLLTGGSRTALPRQQTLQAMMDWSYDLLDEDERTLLRRLSVFGGGFTLEAVEAICLDPAPAADADAHVHGTANEDTDATTSGAIDAAAFAPSILDLVAQLIDKSLVSVDDGAGTPRYRMLETVRQYGREKLVMAGEAAPFRQRHRDWCLALAEVAAREMQGPEQVAWINRIAAEHDNLRAALGWSLGGDAPGDGARLAGALWWFWFVRGFLSEGRDWLDRALAIPDLDEPSRAEAMLGAGALAWRQRDYEAADTQLAASLALYRSLDCPRGIARALHFLGRLAQFQGDYQWAGALYEESLSLAASTRDTWAIAATMDAMGLMAWQQGDFTRAKALLDGSLAYTRQLGDPLGTADALNILGRIAFDQGDYPSATALIEESLAVYRALGDRVAIAYVNSKLGHIALCQGDIARAEELIERSHHESHALGEKRCLAYAGISLGALAHMRGDLEPAARHFEDSLALAREIGDKRGIADAADSLGWLARAQGAPDIAAAHLREALTLYVEMDDKIGVIEALAGLAGTRIATDPSLAMQLLAASEALRQALGAPQSPLYAATLDRDAAALRAAIGDADFEAALTEAHSMPLDAVLTKTLS
jgi:predicted ATPase/class 3 adenylate cyclase